VHNVDATLLMDEKLMIDLLRLKPHEVRLVEDFRLEAWLMVM
jgi:hypothetical protein